MIKVAYTMIDGLPTSKYGTILEKRCEWCYSTIKPIPNFGRYQKSKDDLAKNEPYKTGNIMTKRFCTVDCKEEHLDFMYFKKLKYNRDRAVEKYNEYKTDPKRKEYLKKYRLLNREKINARTKIAVRAFRERLKINNIK